MEQKTGVSSKNAALGDFSAIIDSVGESYRQA
jgi:hypothetical protein